VKHCPENDLVSLVDTAKKWGIFLTPAQQERFGSYLKASLPGIPGASPDL